MLMGAALGVGMVSLAHALGWGPGFAEGFMWAFLLVLVLLVGYGLWGLRGLFHRQTSRTEEPSDLSFMQALKASSSGPTSAAVAVSGRTYNPKNVGNDASARPWESSPVLQVDGSVRPQMAAIGAVQKPFEPQQLSLWDLPNDSQPTQSINLPDVESFKTMAKEHFMQLQDAWDHLDIERLASFLNPEMLGLVKAQLSELGLKPQKTEVMMLQAQWLGYQANASGQHIASVELSGMSREAQETSFTPFREIWSWSRPMDQERSAWLVCGLEPLQ